MRLSADVVKAAPACLNAIKQAELTLRGMKLNAIENLGVTQNQYQCIDFSDNEITKLENFPLLPNIQTILASNNKIGRIAEGMGAFLPNLESLILHSNKLSLLEHLDPLAEFPKLTHLSLVGNLVTKMPNYRLYVLHLLPALKVLDFAKVKPKEREASVKLFGAPINLSSKKRKQPSEEKSNEVPSSTVAQPPLKIDKIPVKALSAEERAAFEEAVLKATTVEEMEKIEKQMAARAAELVHE